MYRKVKISEKLRLEIKRVEDKKEKLKKIRELFDKTGDFKYLLLSKDTLPIIERQCKNKAHVLSYIDGIMCLHDRLLKRWIVHGLGSGYNKTREVKEFSKVWRRNFKKQMLLKIKKAHLEEIEDVDFQEQLEYKRNKSIKWFYT